MNSELLTNVLKTTLIGSMPHKEPKIAVEKIFECVSIPCWPQLPKISFKEQMCPQYSENFPGIKIDEENQKISLDDEEFYKNIEKFYQNYIDKNYDFFKISEDFAIGFYEFLKYLSGVYNQYDAFKLQTTGPITFGFSVKDSNSRAIFYDKQYQEVIIKHLVMKSIWQIKSLLSYLKSDKNLQIILFYDEPYLAVYGSAFTAVSKQDLIDCLNNTISETKLLFSQISNDLIDFKVGVHCCANTDWSILTEVEKLDIISFDTYEYFENFSLYHFEIKNFLKNGGILAWGIIPNNEKIYSNPEWKILEKLNYGINVLINKGIEKDLLMNGLILTPQCGLGNTTEDIAFEVLRVCSNLKKIPYEL